MERLVSIEQAAKLSGYSLRQARRRIQQLQIPIHAFSMGLKKKFFILSSDVGTLRQAKLKHRAL